MAVIEIKNEQLKVKINTLGAEIISIVKDGKERVWQGDPEYWKGHQPVLFPVCGSLKGKKYRYNGKEYNMKPHGFARISEFKVVSLESDKAVLLLENNEQTKECYPFDFKFFVTYSVVDNSVKTAYKAINEGKATAFVSFGSHESFNFSVPFDEGHALEFEKDEKFSSFIVVPGGLIAHSCDEFGEGKTLGLTHAMFKNDTIVLRNINSRRVKLTENGKVIAETAFDAPNLLVWTSVNCAPFVCVEPWLNYPDFDDASGDIKDKDGLKWLEAGEEFINEHTVFYY